ncbi:MAG: hypothetical protein OHK0038_14810 [Flammeovirgaceae bacterium]
MISQKDTGEWSDLAELLTYQQFAFETLEKSILAQSHEDWMSEVLQKNLVQKPK